LMEKFTAHGQTTTYTWDNLARMTSMAQPAGNRFAFEYDAGDRLASITRNDGAQTEYEYDAAGRLTRLTWPDGTAHTMRWFEFSPLKARVETPDGNMFSIQFIQTMGPDGSGELVPKQWQICRPGNNCDPDRSADEPSWNPMTDYPQQQAMFFYDFHNRLESIVNLNRKYQFLETFGDSSTITIETEFQYTPRNQVAGYTDGWTETEIAYSYDALGRISRLGLNPVSSQQLQYDYTFDDLDRLSTVRSASATHTYVYSGVSPLPESISADRKYRQTLAYDSGARLTEMALFDPADNQVFGLDYEYDHLGRLTTESVHGPSLPFQAPPAVAFDVNPADKISSAEVGTDQNGNIVTWKTPEGHLVTAQYNSVNKLQTASYTDSRDTMIRHEFYYNYNGVLAAHMVYHGDPPDDVLVQDKRFLNAGITPMMEDVMNPDDKLVPTAFMAYGRHMGHGVGGLLEVTNEDRTFFPMSDRLGNIRAVLDDQGVLSGRRDYSPYGHIVGQSTDFPINLGQNSKRFFADLGITNYGYRYYHPGLGRWLTRDPLGYEGGMNLYEFAAGNPMHYVDTDGLSVLVAIGIGIAIGLPVNKAIVAIGDWMIMRDTREVKKEQNFTIDALLNSQFCTKTKSSEIYLPGPDQLRREREVVIDHLETVVDLMEQLHLAPAPGNTIVVDGLIKTIETIEMMQ
jgi:RHS repeat-associated protein